MPLSANLLRYYGLYESHRVEGVQQLFRVLLSATVAGLTLSISTALLLGLTRFAKPAAIYFVISFAVLAITRLGLYAGLAWARSAGLDRHRVLFVGTPVAASELCLRLRRNRSWGLEIAYVAVPPEEGSFSQDSHMPVKSFDGGCEVAPGILELLHSHPVDEVVIATTSRRIEDFRPLVALCHQYGISARIMLENGSSTADEPAQSQLEQFAGVVSLAVPGSRHDAVAFLMKRLIDASVSLGLLAALMPVLIVTAILVKLSSPGPILFRQKRMGRYGRVFSMLKFRTMVDGADGLVSTVAARNITSGPAFKARNDWRITPVGRWLRRFSIDELPQLVNVLVGDMSLVGPRPLPVHEALQVSGAFRRRFSVRPGITCLWQVNGRSEVTFHRWMHMDLEYIDRWSLWLDTKLLVQTIPAVISGRGAY